MEYEVWVICNGALEDDETFDTEDARDLRAEELANQFRGLIGCDDWQVFTANVTSGCSVGEGAGEEAYLYAESEQAE